jgi:2-octaprenyl-6-methoxyphenol hydroxylase
MKYDVVVVGGGAVGSLTALMLGVRSRGALRVALVDAAYHRKPSRLRTSALAPGPWRLLQDLTGKGLERYQTSIRVMEVSTSQWSPPSPPDLAFASEDSLASVISHGDLEPHLVAAVQEAGVQLISGEVIDFWADQSSASLCLDGGGALQTSLVVAADGEGSRLRIAAGIRSVERDYRRTALIATICHKEPHHGTALQIFYDPGPFALLPLQGNKSSMVWVETAERAKELALLPPEDLLLLIQEKSKERFGPMIAFEEGPHSFPLKHRHATRLTSNRILLAGDALRRIHPLAGQGLNLGLRDAAAAARCIVEYASIGVDPGAADVLMEYARLRQADSILNAVFLDALFEFFDFDALGTEVARSAALRLADSFPRLKEYFALEAGGLGGDHSFS